jgi:outer membrane protein assembly factor BamD (BamD/ComL family)
MNMHHPFVIVAMVVSGSMLTACSTMDGGLDQKRIKEMPVESVMSSSDKAIAAGDNEKALALLDAGAKAYPTSPQPWLKKAQLYFKAANYPSAILAAEEAIQRDPANEEAKAIALVSSLRIAVKYVSDLRALNDLKGDVRPDAEQLARKLRDTLNATVLVPTATKDAAADPEPKPAPVRYKRPPLQRPAITAAPAAEPPPSSSSNPFGSLK